jgi:hypothetical protein
MQVAYDLAEVLRHARAIKVKRYQRLSAERAA